MVRKHLSGREKHMAKKTLIGVLFVLTLAITIAVFNPASLAVAMEPVKLKIYAGPPSVPADNNIYDCIFVQLQDSNSRPARAGEDTIISLSSSLPSVGTVDPTLVISKDSTFGVAKFYTTFTPGTTTITAAASSYATVSTTLSTIGPIPSALAVYAFPPTIPADGNTYPAIVVQIQDSSGNPARAPIGGLEVSLTCSNTTVGTVQNSLTIPGGASYAVANFQTNPMAAIDPAMYAGTADVIAIKQDYTSKLATIKTQVVAPNPTILKVYVGPTKVMADNIPYQNLIAIQLQNSSGVISRISSDILVNIASSEPLVGTVSSTIMIPAAQNYGFANFASTYRPGGTTITAGAQNLQKRYGVPGNNWITSDKTDCLLHSLGTSSQRRNIQRDPSSTPRCQWKPSHRPERRLNSLTVQLRSHRGNSANNTHNSLWNNIRSSIFHIHIQGRINLNYCTGIWLHDRLDANEHLHDRPKPLRRNSHTNTKHS